MYCDVIDYRSMEAVLQLLNRVSLHSGHMTGLLGLGMAGQRQHMRIYSTERERKKKNTGW